MLEDYDLNALLEKAEGGSPEAMFLVAKLYNAGAFGIAFDAQYAYWLEAFLSSPKIQNILINLEKKLDENSLYAEDDQTDLDYENDSDILSLDDYRVDFDNEHIDDSINFDFYHYSPFIIETGISLGLYYKYSSSIAELNIALNAFQSAWLASGTDYIKIDVGGVTIDIMSLMCELAKRIELIEAMNT